MAIDKSQRFAQELVATGPLLSGAVRTDYLHLLAFNHDHEKMQLKVALGFDWNEHCHGLVEGVDAALSAVSFMYSQRFDAVALVAVDPESRLLMLSETIEIACEMAGIEVLANLRVRDIGDGHQIDGELDGKPFAGIQIDPHDTTTYNQLKEQDPDHPGVWPSTDSVEFESAIQAEFYNREDSDD